MIDGVAPRAKMNQQRSRRFRAARDANIKKREDKERIEDLIKRGLLSEEEANTQRILEESKRHFDSNCITPGTEFMDKVAQSLRWYVHQRMNTEEGWKDIQVIISDASVHGEGEHKIMEFIRRQKDLPSYDPNTKHVLYGLDADLIMLGLATHEPHFTILREFVGDRRTEGIQFDDGVATHVQFQFLMINVLREYLESDMYVDNLPFDWDLERALDDFVFLCFFVGNDFLPHLPTLEIREKAIDLLIELYKKILPFMGGYITKNGDVDMGRAEMLLREIGIIEHTILERRRERDKYFEEKRRNKKAALSLRANHREGKNLADTPIEAEAEVYDAVRLGEIGWKDRYYKDKFNRDLATDHDFIKSLAKSYIEGLAWVMKYYYQGCASWTWFYPYHYAPFAGELVNLAEFEPLTFKKDEPFYPFEQLMTVLPAASCACLPEIYHWYMKDEKSPIIHNYPLDFEIDMNGKKEEWKGVALLPFIDEEELLRVVRPIGEKLTEEEKKRNSRGHDFYMIHSRTNVKYIIDTLEEKTSIFMKEHIEGKDMTDLEKQQKLIDSVSIQLQPKLTKSISGALSPCIQSFPIGGEVKVLSLEVIQNNQTYLVLYFNPTYPDDYIFEPKLLENVTMPEPVLTSVDVAKRRRIKHFGKGMPAQRILDIVNPVRRHMQIGYNQADNRHYNRDYNQRDGDNRHYNRDYNNRRDGNDYNNRREGGDYNNRRDNRDYHHRDYDDKREGGYDRRRSDSSRDRIRSHRSHPYQQHGGKQHHYNNYNQQPQQAPPVHPQGGYPYPNMPQMQYPQYPPQYMAQMMQQHMHNPYQPNVYQQQFAQFPPPQPLAPPQPMTQQQPYQQPTQQPTQQSYPQQPYQQPSQQNYQQHYYQNRPSK